jgi:hypothetical protein
VAHTQTCTARWPTGRSTIPVKRQARASVDEIISPLLASETEFAKVNGTSGSSKLLFYIDSCELLGERQSVLRSSLESPPQDTQRLCFYYPENYPNRSEVESERWSKACV